MAVTFDATGSGYDASLGSTNDFAALLTVGSGADRALVVGLAWNNPNHVSVAVTWDQGGTNQAMTLIGTENHGGGTGRCDLYGLVAPTSGSLTLRVAMSSGFSGELFVCGASFAGVNQTGGATSFANYAEATGTSTTS